MGVRMSYMCKPKGVDGIWVPLYCYSWSLSFDLKPVKKGDEYAWKVDSESYPTNKEFKPTTDFPTWSEIMPAQ